MLSYYKRLRGLRLLIYSNIRDNLLSFLHPFAHGTALDDEPIMAVLVTYFLTQITLFSNINQIASFVTMTFLLTFMVVNLACFLLKFVHSRSSNCRISSAPNFRPSFHYFRWYTAFAGVIISFATMYFVDGVYATVAAAFMFSLFLLIHYVCPPKAWGDVTQSLIYHQVRKFLLRLDTRKGTTVIVFTKFRTCQILASADSFTCWKSAFTMAIHSILQRIKERSTLHYRPYHSNKRLFRLSPRSQKTKVCLVRIHPSLWCKSIPSSRHIPL